MRAFTGRLAYILFKPLWRRLDGSKTRVRAVILHGNDIMLIKNWLGSGRWTLPGGGIGKGETPEMAVAREIKEELGIDIGPKLYKHLGRIGDSELTEYEVEVFAIEVMSDHFKPRRKEIIASAWHHKDKLPGSINDLVLKSLDLVK